jgi:hypothetical protein
MLKRAAESHIRTLLQGFPVVTITGPRQSGKTTLSKMLLADRPYVSLEDPDVRLSAVEDPRFFLDRFPDGAILDEVQRAPDLLSYLQTRVDADGRMGRYLLTGSQQFGLLSGISQSLAGRSAFVELLPFTASELAQGERCPQSLNEMLFSGGYPPLYDRPLTPATWFPSYVTAYVERDVRQLLKVQDLEAFQRFVRLCAGRSGQLLNLAALATDCGITHNTAKAWISVLEASYLLFLLRPYHVNFGKRLVKSPKLYFYDTGLLCWLLGIQSADQLVTHPLRGAIFETYAVSEMKKSACHCGAPVQFHFWRDSHGNEVDVLLETAGRLRPVEIKSGQTVNPDFFVGLERWQALAGDLSTDAALVYGGNADFRRRGVEVIPWRDVGKLISCG